MEELDKRLIDLEIKFTHQDELLQELNQIVAKQQIIIEKMAREIISLNELYTKSDIQGNRTLKDDIPPHY